MNKIKYYFERSYPYVIAFVLTILVCYYEINIIIDENLNEMLYGTITADSIILGFLGALISIVIGKESKLMDYVYANDNENLFSKYIKSSIKYGMLSIIFTLILYIRESIENIQTKVDRLQLVGQLF